MSHITTTGLGLHNTTIGSYSTTTADKYPIIYFNLFTELRDMFELPNIEEKQLQTLNELYDSGDESNKKIAVEIFKYLMKNNDNTTELNQEDIESLGWELNNTGEWWELGNLYPKEGYKEGNHYLGNWKYRILLNSSKSNWYHIDTRNPSNGGQLQIFRGAIKNKSELTKLMQQLGIYE